MVRGTKVPGVVRGTFAPGTVQGTLKSVPGMVRGPMVLGIVRGTIAPGAICAGDSLTTAPGMVRGPVVDEVPDLGSEFQLRSVSAVAASGSHEMGTLLALADAASAISRKPPTGKARERRGDEASGPMT